MKTDTVNLTLYEKDYYLWLENTVQLLKDGQLSALDINHLIEEIEDMGISQKKSVKSNLIVLLWHLLKYKYQPNKRSNSWLLTIDEHRDRLSEDFSHSPSLKRYFEEIFDEAYQKARKKAAIETELLLDIFPSECPFTQEEILNPDYLPD